MKILHTSDWHLGRSLYGRKRYDEFSACLDWLAEFIQTESVDALLIAGDVFDTSTPSNRAQELYYRFLCKVSESCCRHIVVIAGNHVTFFSERAQRTPECSECPCSRLDQQITRRMRSLLLQTLQASPRLLCVRFLTMDAFGRFFRL